MFQFSFSALCFGACVPAGFFPCTDRRGRNYSDSERALHSLFGSCLPAIVTVRTVPVGLQYCQSFQPRRAFRADRRDRFSLVFVLLRASGGCSSLDNRAAHTYHFAYNPFGASFLTSNHFCSRSFCVSSKSHAFALLAFLRYQGLRGTNICSVSE